MGSLGMTEGGIVAVAVDVREIVGVIVANDVVVPTSMSGASARQATNPNVPRLMIKNMIQARQILKKLLIIPTLPNLKIWGVLWANLIAVDAIIFLSCVLP